MCGATFGGRVDAQGDSTVLALHGEADMAVRDDFQALVDEALGTSSPAIVVDLADLRYLESACLRILLHALGAASEQGRSLVVRNASGMVQRVLEVAGVADALTGEDGPG